MSTEVPRTKTFDLIRQRVKEHLTRSSAYNALPKEQRVEIARDTVKALSYILAGEDGTTVPSSVTLGGNHAAFSPAAAAPAGELAGAATTFKPGAAGTAIKPVQGGRNRPGSQQGQLGEAARAGSQAFTDMIADVDFPAFVGGLIDGVFNSIVTTSIKQMEAYAEMVKNVSKSVDQYMKDNVTENHARDYLAERYPDHLEVDIMGEKPRLKPREDYDENTMPDFFADLGLKAPVSSLDDDNVEQEFVPAARRRIAMDRQQLLATMVMMGVNRLVVTNGSIEASCLFELDTTDARRRAVATTADWERNKTLTGEKGYDGSYSSSRSGQWDWKDGDFSAGSKYSRDYKSNWYGKSGYNETAKFKMTTTSSSSSEEAIDMHAKLTGKVKVNFKSDYFPMEKMIDVLQINQIKEKSAAGIAPSTPQPAAPAIAAPPLPALPQLPAPAVPAPAAPAPPAGGAR